eukprot:6720605-Heterocapsa_arctica.AAC.1
MPENSTRILWPRGAIPLCTFLYSSTVHLRYALHLMIRTRSDARGGCHLDRTLLGMLLSFLQLLRRDLVVGLLCALALSVLAQAVVDTD